jgi:hypothetical protein
MWLANFDGDEEVYRINCMKYEDCVQRVIGCIEDEFISKKLQNLGSDRYRFNQAEISLYKRVIDFRAINISKLQRQVFLDMHQSAVDELISVDPPVGVLYAGNWLTVPADLIPIFYELVTRAVIEFHLERIQFIARLNR